MTYTYYHGPRRITKARELRRTQTKAEKLFWDRVRNRKLGGFKIRRQHIINEMIVDFYCCQKRLIIEIDGPYHLLPEQQVLDLRRDHELMDHGYTVLRFTNAQIYYNLSSVLNTVLTYLLNSPSPATKGSAGEGAGG